MALTLGASDVSGNIAFDSGRDRPYITGALESRLLDIEELSGKTGEETEPAPKDAEDDLVLSDSPIVPVDLLRSFDADLTLDAARIHVDDTFYADDTALRIALASGQLTFSAPSTRPLGGAGELLLLVNAQQDRPEVSLQTTLTDINYGPLLDALEIIEGVNGTLDLAIDLQGEGESLHQIAASSNGFWKVIAGEGEVDSNLLGFFSFGAGDLLSPFFGDSGTDRMNCFVSAFDVEDGKARMRAQVLDTSGQPIRGLYACGNDMQNIFGGEYPGPGAQIGPGMVFGYLAAKHAMGMG